MTDQWSQALVELVALDDDVLLSWLRKYLRYLDPSPLRSPAFLTYPDVAIHKALSSAVGGVDGVTPEQIEALTRQRLPSALGRLLREWSLMEGPNYLVRLLDVMGILVVEDSTEALLTLLDSRTFREALRLRPDTKAIVLSNLLEIAEKTAALDVRTHVLRECERAIAEPQCAALSYRELVREDPGSWLRHLPALVHAKVHFADLKLWVVLDDLFSERPSLLRGESVAHMLQQLHRFGLERGEPETSLAVLQAFTAALPLVGVYVQLVPAPFTRLRPVLASFGIHVHNARPDAEEPYYPIRPESIPELWQFVMLRAASDALSTMVMVSALSAQTLLQLSRRRRLTGRMT